MEKAALSLIEEGGGRLAQERVIDRLNLLQEYLQLSVASYTKEQWTAWQEGRPILPAQELIIEDAPLVAGSSRVQGVEEDVEEEDVSVEVEAEDGEDYFSNLEESEESEGRVFSVY